MSTVDSGRQAERAAATYLEMRGYEIIELNWRRPRAEIDIVARKKKTIFFVEVKYRKNSALGSGLEYITGSKLDHMRRGALLWVDENEYNGLHQLAAVEVSGPQFAIEHFIDNID